MNAEVPTTYGPGVVDDFCRQARQILNGMPYGGLFLLGSSPLGRSDDSLGPILDDLRKMREALVTVARENEERAEELRSLKSDLAAMRRVFWEPRP